jgi:hypothetical protein
VQIIPFLKWKQMLNLWRDLHYDNAVFSLLAFCFKLYPTVLLSRSFEVIATESKAYGMTIKVIFILNRAVRYWNLDVDKIALGIKVLVLTSSEQDTA